MIGGSSKFPINYHIIKSNHNVVKQEELIETILDPQSEASHECYDLNGYRELFPNMLED
jgi:hypothetical protein